MINSPSQIFPIKSKAQISIESKQISFRKVIAHREKADKVKLPLRLIKGYKKLEILPNILSFQYYEDQYDDYDEYEDRQYQNQVDVNISIHRSKPPTPVKVKNPLGMYHSWRFAAEAKNNLFITFHNKKSYSCSNSSVYPYGLSLENQLGNNVDHFRKVIPKCKSLQVNYCKGLMNYMEKYQFLIQKYSRFLQVLKLSMRQQGLGPENIKQLFPQYLILKQMRHLYLDFMYNSLDYTMAKRLYEILKNAPLIETFYLNMEDQYLSEEGAEELFPAFQYLQNIQALGLILTSNKIRDQGAIALSKSLMNCTKITNLNLVLQSNILSNDGVIAIGDLIAQLNQLKILHLSLAFNLQIEREGFAYLCNSLFKIFHNIEDFKFSTKRIMLGNAYEYLGLFLEKGIKLKSLYLDVSSSDFDDVNLQQCFKAIAECQLLEYLFFNLVETENMTKEGISNNSTLLPNMERLEKLHLNLSKSKLDSIEFSTVISEIGKMPVLKVLNLQVYYTVLSGEDIKAARNALKEKNIDGYIDY